MSALSECYATITTPFGVKAPYYSRPQGHSGTDYDADAGDPVLAYEHCVVVAVQWSRYIGWCVSARLDDGLFAGWAHGRAPVSVGTELDPGERLMSVAGAGDSPGETWFGAHIHTTLGPNAGSIFEGITYDPAARIARAVSSSPAGGGGYGNIIGKDDDMGFMVAREDVNKTFLFEGDIITRLFDEKSVKLQNYVGIEGGLGRNMVSRDDCRRLAESRGFDWGVVESLGQGETALRTASGTSKLPGQSRPW